MIDFHVKQPVIYTYPYHVEKALRIFPYCTDRKVSITPEVDDDAYRVFPVKKVKIIDIISL